MVHSSSDHILSMVGTTILCRFGWFVKQLRHCTCRSTGHRALGLLRLCLNEMSFLFKLLLPTHWYRCLVPSRRAAHWQRCCATVLRSMICFLTFVPHAELAQVIGSSTPLHLRFDPCHQEPRAPIGA